MALEEYEDLDENSEDLDRGDDLEGTEDEEESEDESTDTEEEEEEESDEDADEEEELPKKKEVKIPKSRLDEVIRQREEARDRNLWLEEQLEKLINQKATPEPKKEERPAYNFEASEEQYISLIIEGEIAKATKLRNEIDKARRDEMLSIISEVKKSAADQAKSESSQALDADRFAALIENMESKYKFLDTNHKSYNEEAVDTINTLLAGYIAAGKSRTEGLRLAVSKVAPLYEKEVTTSKPSLGKKRTEEAGKKAVVAAKSQPTKTKTSSVKNIDLESININKLSDKDFKNLTEKEKRHLRGDF